MPTIPYLHFRGHCAEALTFYAEAFRSPPPQMMRYGEEPGGAALTSGPVMHGQIALGDGTLMASDYPPGVAGEAMSGTSVMQTTQDAAEARRVFDLLAQGGQIINPMESTFFSPAFGMLRDRFGTAWIISALPEEATA